MGGYPVPYTSWPPGHVRLFVILLPCLKITMIYYLKALGWSGEGIVHLEELAFWVFLIHLKENSPPWFKSTFFKAFILLSLASTGTMISIVSILKADVMLTEGVLMTVATGYNTLMTCGFFWVFSKFPAWLMELKKRGAPAELTVRLHAFGTLNEIRMVFRLLFTAPLLALSADGLMSEPFLNNQVWIVDLIVMTSLVAFAAQGVITLLIFLPRNFSKECELDTEDSKMRAEMPSNSAHTINQCSESLDFFRRDSNSIEQESPRSYSTPAPSPSTTIVLSSHNAKHRSINCDMSTLNRRTSATFSPPFSFSELGQNHGGLIISDLNHPSCSTPLQLRQDIIEPSSQITIQGAETHSQAFPRVMVDVPPSPCASEFPSEKTNQPDRGGFVSFPLPSPLTHFPRYFAPSETHPSESCGTEQAMSLRTVSHRTNYQQPSTSSTRAISQPSARLSAIHPAIRNFKSPIDV
ncbi:hypothetical protein Pst134EA_007240 [Puccinia striiformis f. sp. tritici]|uniref:hypothetical protein n=1 Tax=Puccinia striiformis f. sp. tritici TaxID=168172 RepID=UPI002007C9C7|nr:hypothetical protein Pst134EA_007240 [Puccinia striiformis f. sp. tritici]KAH9469969.1 hypothetical protein Pst134EA_007240 [Puccinia striiformis f. sp. tritici]